jgi:hypothetical protein
MILSHPSHILKSEAYTNSKQSSTLSKNPYSTKYMIKQFYNINEYSN